MQAEEKDAPSTTTTRWPLRHPVATTAIAAAVVAVWNLLWLASHRHLGGYGVDESSYLGQAFAIRRALLDHGPIAAWHAINDGGATAPFLPALSAAFMLIGGASPIVGVSAATLLCAVSAVAVAAVAIRLTTPAAALVGGLVATGLPVMVVSGRYYQQSAGVTTFLCLAVAALLRSDRGENRRAVVATGVAVGLMLISRTMSVAFLPGLVVCAALVMRRSSRSLQNALLGVGAAALVAGPWWASHAREVVRYLVGFGYGHESTQINEVPPLLRVPVRIGLVLTDVRPLLVVPALVGLVAASIGFARHRRARATSHDDGGVRRFTVRLRGGGDVAAVTAVVVLGAAALLTSSNLGSWFQMPLEVLAIAPVCAFVSAHAGRLRRGLATAVLAIAIANVALISSWRPGSSVTVGDGTLSMALFGGTEDSQALDFAHVDPRFRSSSGWATRAQAEHDWKDSATRILDELERVAGPRTRYSFFGENRLLRGPTVAMIAAATGRPVHPSDQPLRPEGTRRVGDPLGPPRADDDRALVILRTPYYLDVERLDSPDWVQRAVNNGWVERRRIPTPDGGEAVILVANGAGTGSAR